MSLANIVSGVINKESKVDRKKLAYFFKDSTEHRSKAYSLGLLLRILSPTDITILETQETFVAGEDNIVKRIQEMTAVLFPEVPVTVIHGYNDGQGNIAEHGGDVVNKEKLMTVDVGLFIDRGGNLFVYKGFGVPDTAAFYVPNLDQEGFEELRDADLDVLLPTKNMWLVNELTRNREAEIAICYFGTDSKRDIIKKVNQLTGALLNASIKVCLSTHYFNEDFNGWESEKESVKVFDVQHDFVLAVRGDRVDIHLPYENGAVAKEPNGWLLLN